MSSLRYRPDIDGLRAVAVLGVVIYHAFPWMIPGGFIGVDIFFVISGYLISGILYKGHSEGNFRFREFYARRIKRLFPALITMLVITLAYGWMILLPDEFAQLGKHVVAGTLFIQNFAFWQESGYFDTAASLKPLLHLWSLAVEEQFYIFFPLLLILLWKKPKFLIPSMGILLISTFILNVVMSVQNGVSDFFLTPYRAWEFLGGSLLAWWHDDRGHEEEIPAYREAFSWGGAILLLLGMAFIRTGDPYPGWRALLPVAGTLLLMEGGMGAWVNRKILSNGTVVWIGLISYPLYLFHWPALSFVHIVKGESPKPGYIVAALLVALLLTVTTYYLIEKKIRHNRSRLIIPILIASFLLTGILGELAWKGVFSLQITNREATVAGALKDRDFFQGTRYLKSKVYLNTTGGDGEQTIFVGDSNMQQYAPRISKLMAENSGKKRGAIFITSAGCLPVAGYTVPERPHSLLLMPEFQKIIETDPRIDRVVFAAIWPEYFKSSKVTNSIDGIPANKPEAFSKALENLGCTIKKLRARGKEVTVVLSIPYNQKLDPSKFFERSFSGASYKCPEGMSEKDFVADKSAVLEKIATTAKINGANVIDPLDSLCVNGLCIINDENGIPIRYDEGHLRPGYVREHVKYLDRTVAP